MVSVNLKYLPERTASDKEFRFRFFNVSENPKCDGYQRGLASMFYNFFDKKSTIRTGIGINTDFERKSNKSIRVHKPITRNF